MTQTTERIGTINSSLLDIRSTLTTMTAGHEEMRESLAGIITLQHSMAVVIEKTDTNSKRLLDLEERTTGLETWRTQEKAWIAAASLIGSGLTAVLFKLVK